MKAAILDFRELPRSRTTQAEGGRTGNKKLFVCPYHAWSYGTNGEWILVWKPCQKIVC